MRYGVVNHGDDALATLSGQRLAIALPRVVSALGTARSCKPMSRTAPRTGGKAAPKNHSPPRDAAAEDASGTSSGSGSGSADTLRTRRRSDAAAGGNDDAASGKAGASHWNTLRDLLEHKALLQAMLRGSKAIHANVSDAARCELNVAKRLALHACSYALNVPATLADQPRVMSALKYADRGIGWAYDRAGGTVGRLAAEGERVAHDSGKAFDATVSATPAKAEMTPVVTATKLNGGGGIKQLLYQFVAVAVYLAVAGARAVVQALANPRATADAIKCGVGNAFSLDQWKLRLNGVWHAGQRVWASRTAKVEPAAEPGGPVRSALLELFGAVALVLMPWRPMPNPMQRAQ